MEHMKSNEMERERYNAVPPVGKGLLGLLWGLFFSGQEEELPSCLRPEHWKAGLIMWSSISLLIEMLSLILSPVFGVSAAFRVF